MRCQDLLSATCSLMSPGNDHLTGMFWRFISILLKNLSFLPVLEKIVSCVLEEFVSSSWAWLEVDLMEKGVMLGVIRRGGEGYIHPDVCLVSGSGLWTQVMANQSMQKSLPTLVSLALLPQPFSWGGEEWKDSRDLWSLPMFPLTMGSNRGGSTGCLSLLAKSG